MTEVGLRSLELSRRLKALKLISGLALILFILTTVILRLISTGIIGLTTDKLAELTRTREHPLLIKFITLTLYGFLIEASIQLFEILKNLLNFRYTTYSKSDLELKIHSNLLNLRTEILWEELGKARLATLMEHDLEIYNKTRVNSQFNIINSILNITLTIGYIYMINPIILFITIPTLLLLTLPPLLLEARRKRLVVAASRFDSRLKSSISETLENLIYAKSLARSKYLKRYLGKALRERNNNNERLLVTNGIAAFFSGEVVTLFEVIIRAILMVVTLTGAVKFNLTLGELFIVTILINRLTPSLINISNSLSLLRGVSPLVKDYLRGDRNMKEGIKELGNIRKITIRKLTLKLGRRELFSNLNLDLEADRIYGLRARSGFGKTTLLEVIAGLRDNYEGDILINDLDVKRLDDKLIRERIRLIQSDCYLFKDGLINNINLWDKRLDANNLLASVNLEGEIRGADKDAELLSQGQKQRACLARMLALDNQVILFDEALSNIDKRNLKQIKERLTKLKQGRILILVSHHISDNDSLFDEVIDLETRVKK